MWNLFVQRIAVIAQKFELEADQTEKWYGTKYKMEKIPEDTLKVSYFLSLNLSKNLNTLFLIFY